MKDQDEMFDAATETPAFLGCPSLGPKTLPGGFDGVEPTTIEQSEQSSNSSNLEFCGLKLNRFGAPGLGTKLIGKRVNVDKTVQVFEIEVKRANLATGARAFVTENGELLFSLVGGKSFVAVEQMAVSALHGLLKRRRKHNSRTHLASKAKRAAATNEGKI